jgi:hypothetical protein
MRRSVRYPAEGRLIPGTAGECNDEAGAATCSATAASPPAALASCVRPSAKPGMVPGVEPVMGLISGYTPASLYTRVAACQSCGRRRLIGRRPGDAGADAVPAAAARESLAAPFEDAPSCQEDLRLFTKHHFVCKRGMRSKQSSGVREARLWTCTQVANVAISVPRAHKTTCTQKRASVFKLFMATMLCR